MGRKGLKRLPGKTDSRLPSAAHAPLPTRVCTHAPAASDTGVGGRVARKTPWRARLLRFLRLQIKRRGAVEGGRTHAENGGKRPTFQADARILGRPSQTVNTFLNKSFLLAGFRRPRIGELSFCFARIILRPARAGLGRGRGKVQKLRPRTGPRSPHPRSVSLSPYIDEFFS